MTPPLHTGSQSGTGPAAHAIHVARPRVATRFAYTMMAGWPPLAWLAQCPDAGDVIRVHHGGWVERTEQWFCEAVWAGDFPEGRFDTTDIVAGSGARLQEDDAVVFVSSGSNLDRLHSLRTPNGTLVSNSLCCLLAWVDGSADLGRLDYTEHFSSYRYALFGDYSRVFPSTAGPVEVTYFANLVWDGSQLRPVEKSGGARRFERFADYREFLRQSMTAVARNAAAGERARPFRLVCAVSRGYDSPAVAAIAREVEGVEALTFELDRTGRDDSGASIASVLGIPCRAVDRNAWRSAPIPEVPFVACSGSVGDLAFKGAEALLRGTVLLNGTSASLVWKRGRTHTEPIAVGDGALLGLTEYRLWTGFINCPVPSWGIRSFRDVARIGTSSEMAPWDVGGVYNKPIPRRIIEEAGVARDAFATHKSGVSETPRTRRDYLLASSRDDLLAWLGERRRQQLEGAGRLPSPRLARMLDGVIGPLHDLVNGVTALAGRTRLGRTRVVQAPLARIARYLRRPYYHHAYTIHWAVDRAKRRYATLDGGR